MHSKFFDLLRQQTLLTSKIQTLMKYIVEDSLRNFKAWAGGADTLKELTLDEIDIVDEGITECYEGIEVTETEINDFLWFERDVIAEWIGYKDWESFLKMKKGEE